MQAPDNAPETWTWSTRTEILKFSALGVGLPYRALSGARTGLTLHASRSTLHASRGGRQLAGRNLDGNQIAWKYRTCAGHEDLLFRDGLKRRAGKCDFLLVIYVQAPSFPSEPRANLATTACAKTT